MINNIVLAKAALVWHTDHLSYCLRRMAKEFLQHNFELILLNMRRKPTTGSLRATKNQSQSAIFQAQGGTFSRTILLKVTKPFLTNATKSSLVQEGLHKTSVGKI